MIQMPLTRPSIPLNDGVLSTLRAGAKVRCEPPRVNTRHLPLLLVHRNIKGLQANSSPDGVPPPIWSHRGVNRWPSMGRPRIMATPYNVTVVSPHERWSMWVSGRDQSTSAINVAESIISRPLVMRRASDRNPAHRMNSVYHSSHVKGLCVRILSGNSHCGIQ
jgi:hypothetical protein